MAKWITNGASPRQKSLIERNMDAEGKVPFNKAHLYDKPVVVPVKKPGLVSNILSGLVNFAKTPLNAPLKVNLTPQQINPLNPFTIPHDTYNKVLNSQGQFNDSANQNSPFMKKVNAAQQADIKAIPANAQAELLQQQKDNATIKNPLLKFLARTSQSAGNMATLGNGARAEVDTGNKAANFAADTLGSVGGAVVNPMGLGDTLYSGASKFVGNPLEKVIAKKIGTDTIAKRFVPSVVGNAGTMAAINAGLEAPQAKSIKDVGKAALTGAAQGALFGGALHGVKEGNAALDSNLSKSLDMTSGFNLDTGVNSRPILKPNNLTPNVVMAGAGMANLNNKDTKNKSNTNVPVDNLNPLKTANMKIEQPSATGNTLEVPQSEIRQAQRQEIANEPLKTGEVPTKLSMNVVSSDKGNKTGFKTKIGNAANNFYTHAVDRNKAISDFSKDANKQGGNSETYIKATNAANVSTKVSHIMDQGLTDKQGNPIDISYKQLVKSMPKDKTSFINYLLQSHNIDRSIEGKAIDSNYSASQSHQAVLKILQDHPEYEAQGKKFTGWINKFMGEYGNKSGLISDDLWKNLNDTYKNYLPTNRDFTDIEGVNPATNGKGFVGQSIPLKKLSTNSSSRDITDPYESVMNTINRTVRGATNNDVAQSMLKDIQVNPEGMKKWGEVIPEGEVNPNVNNVVTVLDKGKKVNVQINDINLLKSLEGFQKGGDHPIQNAFRKVTNPYKAMITTKNPLFTVRNMARDIPTAYVNGSEHNPVMFAGKYIKSMVDLARNTEEAKQYHALGGGGSNFDSNQNTAKGLKDLTRGANPLRSASHGIENTNNIVESTPRFSEFKTALKKGDSLDKAMFKANEITTNFSRGGDYIKAADSLVPYLNAGVQGLDKVIRQFKDHPAGTVAKGLISVTIPTLAVNNMNKDNPNYTQLDNRTKDNYYCFPNPADGGKTFIKLPKSREIGVLFGSLAERIIRQNNGEANAFKGFLTSGGIKGITSGTAFTNFAPTNPLENNMFSPFITNLPSNKDFAGRTIVPQAMQDRSAYLQYDDATSEIGKKLGELTGLSPKQIDYIIKSYTGVIGQVGLPAATKVNYGDNTQGNLLKSIKTNFTADPLYSNQSMTDFYDNVDKYTKIAGDRNFTENLDPKLVTPEEYTKNALNGYVKDMSDLSKQATKAAQDNNPDLVKSLRQQMVDIAKTANEDIGNEPVASIENKITQSLKDPTGAVDAKGNVKSNNGDEAQALRAEVQAVKDSNDSVVNKRQQLNDLYNKAQDISMPVTEFTNAISANMKDNVSKESTAIRAKVTQITHSNLSVKEQRTILQGVVEESKRVPVRYAKKKVKKDTLNPFNK